MKRISIVFLLFLVVILTSCTNIDYSLNMVEVGDEISSTTKEDLSAKYDGTTIEYTGVVQNITENLLFEGIDLYGVVCLMDIETIDAEIILNMKITVRGTAEVQDMKNIYLDDCSIEKTHTTVNQAFHATDYNESDLLDAVLDIFEITGEVVEVKDFNSYQVISLYVTSDQTLNIAIPGDIDLSEHTVGDEVIVTTVWDGTNFHGYAID